MISNRRFLTNIFAQLIQTQFLIDNFPKKLARLETPSNPNKTNANHEF
jgi:hypothetical protein